MATTYTDTTEEVDETIKIIEKEYTIPETTGTEVLNMGNLIERMDDAQSDIEKILIRFNSAREKYNEALVGLESKTKPLAGATASFPTVPTKATE